MSVVSTQRSVTRCGYGGGMPCVFCGIVAGTAPAIRVYGMTTISASGHRPFTRGHTGAAKRHTVDLTDTPPRRWPACWPVGQQVARPLGFRSGGRRQQHRDQRRQGRDADRLPHPSRDPRRNGDRLAFAKGMLVRRDPDREATGRILRAALGLVP